MADDLRRETGTGRHALRWMVVLVHVAAATALPGCTKAAEGGDADPSAAEQEARKRAVAAQKEAQMRTDQLIQHELKVQALAKRAAAAKSDAEREQLLKELTEEQKQIEALRPSGGAPPRKPNTHCAPGDPLCTE